jgi:uncharacterized membrane protein
MRSPDRPDSTANTTTAGRRRRLVLLALILVALGLRMARLGFQPLWWDEGWSLYFATLDLGSMLARTAVDIHPPFYYLLLHLWTGLFGTSAGSARLLSVLLGTATVPLLYATGRRLLGFRGGLAAAFLLAISPFHIYYSQEVRMYVLVTLLGLAATHFALRCPTGRWNARGWGAGSWAAYVLTATAALYSQYYAAFLLLALNLVVLARWLRGARTGSPAGRSGRALGSWLGAQAAVLLLFLPWLWYAGGKLLTYVRFKVSVEQDLSLGLFPYLARHLAAFTWGHAEGPLANWWWLGLLPLIALVLALAFVFWRRGRLGTGRLVGWDQVATPAAILAVTLLCGFAVNLVFPFNPPRSERLLLLALPAYLLLVTAGLLVLRRARRSLAIASMASFVVVALVSLGFFYTVPRYPDDDYRPLIERVRALGLPGDAVLAIHPWQVGYFQAYIPDDEARPTLVLTPREVIPRERQIWADEPTRMASELDALLAEHGRLWLLDHRAMGRALERRIEAYLVEHAYPTLSEWYGANTVLSFYTAGEPETQPVTARFAGWLALEGVALDPGPLEAGWGTVPVDLLWQLSEQPGEDYTVGLRLVGPTGHTWAQRDTPPNGGLGQFSDWPPGEPVRDRHGLLVPAGTPPGDYSLTLRVYRSRDVAVLPAAFEGGSGGEVMLGSVRVVRPQAPPPLEALAFEQPLGVDFGDRLRLLGYTTGQDLALLPGEAVEVALFWQALADPGEDFLPRLQLLDAEDRVLAEISEKPVAGTYPTAWWRAGELVRDPHDLPIPAAVPPGRYRLALDLVRAADGQPVEFEPGQVAVKLAEVEVLGREHRFEPTAPQHRQEAQFGASVTMTGYDLPEVASVPGSTLEVTLHWHVLETPDRNYHTFVHLLDADGGIVAQHDGPPAGGELPALGWLPGEYLTDTHVLQLPFDLPPGEYRLGVGLYDPNTGLRPGEQAILDDRLAVPGE